jgi:hypothetical protein
MIGEFNVPELSSSTTHRNVAGSDGTTRVSVGVLVVWAALGVGPVFAQSPTPTTPYKSLDLKYEIALPIACRHVEGPGTLEAICASDLDSEAGKEIPAAGAFLLEIDAEQVPADAKPYTEANFREELPEAVCGGGDAGRVTISAVAETKHGTDRVLTADVVCPAIKFLGLPARSAQVRYVIAAGFRYRLMARAPTETLDKLRPIAVAFFNSFKSTAEKAP